MLTNALEYLNGWTLSTSVADREEPEWPPHLDRVFMALVAAHFEGQEEPVGRAALEWLESQPDPVLYCSPAQQRTTVVTFVPVNDRSKSHYSTPSGSMQLYRDRQPRTFPVAVPDDPVVCFVWEVAEPPPEIRQALDRLCREVTSVGHSASLVRMWVRTAPPGESAAGSASTTDLSDERRQRWMPSDLATATARLRSIGPGRLLELEHRFNREGSDAYWTLKRQFDDLKPRVKQAKKQTKKELQAQLTEVETRLANEFPEGPPVSLRPTPLRWQGYALAGSRETLVPACPQTHWSGDLLVFRFLSTRQAALPLTATQQVCEALRNCLLAGSTVQPAPEWLCGHQPDGRPANRERGHLALFPLPHVGRQHASGHLLGVALAIPRDVPQTELTAVLREVLYDKSGQPREFSLLLGGAGVASLVLQTGRTTRQSLQPHTWTAAPRGATRWATVTPVALDRHLRQAHSWDEVTAVLRDTCRRIGLPKPRVVVPSPVSMFIGALTTREMPRLVRKSDGGLIRQVHAYLEFDEPVVGPILLGAGRYRGYGLCRPLQEID